MNEIDRVGGKGLSVFCIVGAWQGVVVIVVVLFSSSRSSVSHAGRMIQATAAAEAILCNTRREESRKTHKVVKASQQRKRLTG